MNSISKYFGHIPVNYSICYDFAKTEHIYHNGTKYDVSVKGKEGDYTLLLFRWGIQFTGHDRLEIMKKMRAFLSERK